MRKKKQTTELEEWQRPLVGCANLWWRDQYGNLWDNNPSEAFFKADYGQQPMPTRKRKRHYSNQKV